MSATSSSPLQDSAYIKMKSHFHGVSSAKRPANKAPNHPPTGAPAPKNPRLRLRILPGGSVVPMMAMALGTIIAAPIPLKALATLKAIKLSQNALMNDQTAHHAAPLSKTFLWPYMEPSRPVIRTKAPEVNLEEDACQPVHRERELQAAHEYDAGIHAAWLGPSTPRDFPMISPPPIPRPNEIIFEKISESCHDRMDSVRAQGWSRLSKPQWHACELDQSRSLAPAFCTPVEETSAPPRLSRYSLLERTVNDMD